MSEQRPIKPGDWALRNLAGAVMRLKITEVTDTRIKCGEWEFDKSTGAEIDEFLNWGPPPLTTGSAIVAVVRTEEGSK